MNKAELTAAIVKKTGFTKKDAEKAIAAVTDVITETLAAGEKVQIVGFGGFEVRSRPARVARNPRTGEQISIEASKAPVFKAGKALKDSVNKVISFWRSRRHRWRYARRPAVCSGCSAALFLTLAPGGQMQYDGKKHLFGGRFP